MKKLVIPLILLLTLSACSNNSNATKPDSSDAVDKAIELSSKKEAPKQESTIDLTETTVHTDSDGYLYISGNTESNNNVSIIYDGTVIDSLPVDQNFFEYYTMGNDQSFNLTLTQDEYEIGDSVSINDLDSRTDVKVIADGTAEVPGSNSSETDSEIYEFGEEVKFGSDLQNPVYSVKVIKVTKGYSNFPYLEGSLDQPDNALQVTYEYKNYSLDEPFELRSQFITPYNVDGQAGQSENYVDGQNEVGKGRSSHSTAIYIMPTAVTVGDPIEIDYGGDFDTGYEGVTTFKGSIE